MDIKPKDVVETERMVGHMREHIASGDCWCNPELDSIDKETGSEVWVHRRADN